jgi:LuxR family quorum sensing-dependent transcriptional regulator
MRHDPFEYGRDAFEFVERLNGLSTTSQVLDSMQTAIARHGLETLLLIGLPNPDQRFEDIVLGRRWPREWLKIYTEEQYVHVDPVLRHLRRTAGPFEWSEVRFDAEREPRGAELMGRRHEFGFDGALVVPISGPGGNVACVSMSARKFTLTPRDRRPLHLMAYYAFEKVAGFRRRQPLPIRRSLTEREREVLSWAAMGKSAWEVSEILSIAERTVNEHAQTAFQKLGAMNKTHAVALAIRDRLIAV